MKISGAMLNPHREITELALHLPPLEIQVELLTVKFLCKCLTADDCITSTLCQADGALQKELHFQLKSIKKYIVWKAQSSMPSRNIDLLDPNTRELTVYTKGDMNSYQQKIWMDRIKNRSQLKKHSFHNDEVVFQIASDAETNKLALNKNNFLFNHSTTKKQDSMIMDYVHGSSLIFGNIRQTVCRAKDSKCYFCHEDYDTPEHQLLNCPEVKDETYSQLCELMNTSQGYLSQILLPTNRHVQLGFIKRIIFLLGQHEFVEEMSI